MLLRLGLLVALSGDGCSALPVEPEVLQAVVAVPVGPAPIAPADADPVHVTAVDTPPAPASRTVLVDVLILEKYRSFRESLSTP